jgi:protocatechuate 3,4-dioxygenase, beta subunit
MAVVTGCQPARENGVTLRRFIQACALVAVGACGTGESFGQADPYWMKSWNKAQDTRPATMTSSARIAPADEPGTPLVLRGLVVEPDGRTPAAGVVVHSYHRDQQGFDFGPNDSAASTWRLQGWAKTDTDGRFEFRTIRPSPDHLGREAAHIHFTLESKEFGRQWAPTLYVPDKAGAGVQQVMVNIRLKQKADF